MKYLLDTNACIQLLRGRSEKLAVRVSLCPPEQITIAAIVLAELYDGAERSTDPATEHSRVADFVEPFLPCLPFEERAAREFGRVRAYLAQAGTPIGPLDLLIAATALAHGLTLVSHNLSDFSRIPGLLLEDWEGP